MNNTYKCLLRLSNNSYECKLKPFSDKGLSNEGIVEMPIIPRTGDYIDLVFVDPEWDANNLIVNKVTLVANSNYEEEWLKGVVAIIDVKVPMLLELAKIAEAEVR